VVVVDADVAQEPPDGGDDGRVGVVGVEGGPARRLVVPRPPGSGALDLLERRLLAGPGVATFVEDAGERPPPVPAGEDVPLGRRRRPVAV
jgi:hypothetical protein